MSKKMTKRNYFNALLAIPAVSADDGLVSFIEHEIELLDKKNSAERKPSAKQIEKQNADNALREAIVAEMEQDTLYSATDICDLPTPSAVDSMSVAKASFLMRALVENGKVVRVVEKRHTFYRLAV